MIGDNAKRLLIANTVKKRFNSRAVVNLNYEPLKKGDSPLTDDDIVVTDGMYYMRYEPVTKGNNYVDKPFLIKSDLFTMDKIRVNIHFDIFSPPEPNITKDNTAATPITN